MLKRHISTLIIAAAVSLTAAAQSATQPADSMSVQQKRLTERRAELRKLITEADAQRNKTREGVAAATNEALNDRQDSICLDLSGAAAQGAWRQAQGTAPATGGVGGPGTHTWT